MIRRPRRAMTLLEVLVTLVIIALVTSVAALAAPRRVRERDELRAMLDDSLAAAIAQARHITIRTRRGDRTLSATVHPDGSIMADSEFLTGKERPSRALR